MPPSSCFSAGASLAPVPSQHSDGYLGSHQHSPAPRPSRPLSLLPGSATKALLTPPLPVPAPALTERAPGQTRSVPSCHQVWSQTREPSGGQESSPWLSLAWPRAVPTKEGVPQFGLQVDSSRAGCICFFLASVPEVGVQPEPPAPHRVTHSPQGATVSALGHQAPAAEHRGSCGLRHGCS